MEVEELEPEYHQGEEVEIYSKRAIWGFSIFFGTIFGGVLLMLNLRAAGFKRAALQVIFFSIAFTLFASIIFSRLAANARAYGIFANIIGGVILTEYFFKKYFPEDDYFPKPIWKPLLISILIAGAFTWLLLSNGGMSLLK